MKTTCQHKNWVKNRGGRTERCTRCGLLRIKHAGGFFRQLFCSHQWGLIDGRKRARRNRKVICKKCGKPSRRRIKK